MVLVVPATPAILLLPAPCCLGNSGIWPAAYLPSKVIPSLLLCTAGDSCIEEQAKLHMLYSTCHSVSQNLRESGFQTCPTYVTWLLEVDTNPIPPSPSSRIISIQQTWQTTDN